MNTLVINSGDRPTLVNAGLIPLNSAGTWSVRKLSSGYMFMEYKTYNGRFLYATVNGGTLSEWNEAVSKNPNDAYPTFKQFQIPANSNITLTITGRSVITAIGDNNGRNMFICRVANSTLNIDELGTSSKISTSISGTDLTLTSTEPNVVFLYVTIYSGDVNVSE